MKTSMMSRLACFLILSSTLAPTTYAARWNAHNNPFIVAKFDKVFYQANFFALAKSGALTEKPWTDDYWPTYHKGLAHRWQQGILTAEWESKKFLNLEELKSMQAYIASSGETTNLIDGLSPAEKFDIACGNYHYPLTIAEEKRCEDTEKSWREMDKEEGVEFDINRHTWEGLCHGWAPAALKFKEPKRIVFVNADGVEVPMATSDIKALLTIMQGNYKDPATENCFVGTRAEKTFDVHSFDATGRKENNDVNAGAFHLILANRLSILNKGFVFDRTTDAEVWNQPVEGFEILEETVAPSFPGEGAGKADPQTQKEVKMKVRVDYTVEVEPHRDALNAEDRSLMVASKEYEYILELDAGDKIIGGRWISADYPDFIWDEGVAKFGPSMDEEGHRVDFSKLKDIYDQSTSASAHK